MKRFLVLVVAGLSLLPGRSSAATITVNTTEETSSDPAKCTLGQAVQASQTDAAAGGCGAGLGDDVIVVPAGTYTLTTQVGANAAFVDIAKTVSIQGAGPEQTILERAPTAPDFRFFYNPQASGAVLSLSGLTLRNGKAAGGAAVRSIGGTLTVTNCVFQGNDGRQGNGEGGAISTSVGFGGVLTVTNSRFENNQALMGGAIQTNGKVTLQGSTFSNNIATGTGGGAVKFASLNGTHFLQVSNCTFLGNSSVGNPGGAVHSTGYLRIDHTSFANNSSGGSAGAHGGALYAWSGTAGTLQLEECEFYGNQSAATAGALDISGFASGVTVTGCAFYGNTAVGSGGALRGGGAFANCTFAGNTSGAEGGAIYSQQPLTLNNVTVAGNNAATGAGGVRFDNSGLFTLSNTVLAQNTIHTSNPTANDCLSDVAVVSAGHNLVGVDCNVTAATGDQIGTLASPLDPQLDALDKVTHALMPRPTSPLVDRGSPAAAGTAGACEAADQVGTARPIDGDDDGTSRCDIGALEAPPRPVNDLSLALSANPTSAVAGVESVSFTATIENVGSRQATGIQLVHVLSQGLQYQSSSPSSACVASSSDPQVIECTAAELAPGDSAMVVLRAAVTSAGTHTDHASVDALEHDPVPANNLASASVSASAPSADLAVTLTPSTTSPHAGLPLTLVTTVKNLGPHPATGVALTQSGLSGLQGVTSLSAPSGTCTGTESVSCTLGDLAVSAEVTVTVQGTPAAAGSMETLVLAQSQTGDPVSTNNGVSLQLAVQAMPPDAGAPGPDAAEPGLDAAAPAGPDAAPPAGPDAAEPGLDAAQPAGPDAATARPDAGPAACSNADSGAACPICPRVDGCGCATSGSATAAMGLVLGALVLVPWRRRRS